MPTGSKGTPGYQCRRLWIFRLNRRAASSSGHQREGESEREQGWQKFNLKKVFRFSRFLVFPFSRFRCTFVLFGFVLFLALPTRGWVFYFY